MTPSLVEPDPYFSKGSSILDLPADIIGVIADQIDNQNDVFNFSLACKTTARLARGSLRSRLVYRGRNTRLKDGLYTILLKVFEDPQFALSVRTLVFEDWMQDKWTVIEPRDVSTAKKRRLQTAADAAGMSSELHQAIMAYRNGREERMLFLLLQLLKGVRHLRLSSTLGHCSCFPDRQYPYTRPLAADTPHYTRPMLANLRQLHISTFSAGDNENWDFARLAPYLHSPSLASITLERPKIRDCSKLKPLPKSSVVKQLVLGEPSYTMADQFHGEDACYAQPRGLAHLLEACPNLESLAYYHNANYDSDDVGDLDFSTINPRLMLKAIGITSSTLKRLIFTNTDPEWVEWRHENRAYLESQGSIFTPLDDRIGSFRSFLNLTELTIQLLLLGKLPPRDSPMSLQLHLMLPHSLEVLTLLECSRPETYNNTLVHPDGDPYDGQAREVVHYVHKGYRRWTEEEFVAEMRLLAANVPQKLPSLRNLFLGDAEWNQETGSIIPHLQKEVFNGTSISVAKDTKFRSWKLGRVVFTEQAEPF